MDLVKTCITWTIWKESLEVTKLKLEVVSLKALVMLKDPHPALIVKETQEQLKFQQFLELK